MKSSTNEPTHKPGRIFVLPECCIWRRDTRAHNCMSWGSAEPQPLWVVVAAPPKDIAELTQVLPLLSGGGCCGQLTEPGFLHQWDSSLE